MFDLIGQAFVSHSNIGRPEVRYGPAPKFDPYVDEQGNKPQKYLSTPWFTKFSPDSEESTLVSSVALSNPATTVSPTKTEVSEVVEDTSSISSSAHA
jgi:hypothetical protein